MNCWRKRKGLKMGKMPMLKNSGSIIIKHIITSLIAIVITLGAILPVYAGDMNVQREKQTREQIRNILSSSEFSGEKKQPGILKTVADMIKSIAEWINEQIKKLKIPDKSVS